MFVFLGATAQAIVSDEPASSENPITPHKPGKGAKAAGTDAYSSPSLSSSQPGKLSGVGNYALNRPGIVMIRTEYSANVYVNSMKMDSRAFNALLDSIQKLDHGGGVTAEQKLDIVLKEMNGRPNRFFVTTFDYIKQPEQITATGTGFFLTGNGYVATNCHLIEREESFIRRQFILSAFHQITDASIAALETSWATHFTEQQRSLLYNTYASVYSRLFSMILYDLKKNIYVVYRSDKSSLHTDTVKKPAAVIAKGEPMPGKDIAILKIAADEDMPVLRLTQTGLPQVGEQLFVYGYPGPVTNNDFVSSASAIEPTMTTGIVSAIKNPSAAGHWSRWTPTSTTAAAAVLFVMKGGSHRADHLRQPREYRRPGGRPQFRRSGQHPLRISRYHQSRDQPVDPPLLPGDSRPGSNSTTAPPFVNSRKQRNTTATIPGCTPISPIVRKISGKEEARSSPLRGS
ncbi:hypothetical protein ACQ86N_38795 [Puia sp. P3]|uniref:hypothetical protein n=1 Tax=Puia sp. P3 TaxID=3423952 RepID=UPI003D67FF1A